MSDNANDVSRNGGRPHVRKYMRAPVSMDVAYTRDGHEETKKAHSSDLGGGGLRLATDDDLPLGTILLMRFRLPAWDREMFVRGRIVLSFFNAEQKQYYHGIAFTHIDPRDQEEIIRFVAAEAMRNEAKN